jgi:hypothetical protein
MQQLADLREEAAAIGQTDHDARTDLARRHKEIFGEIQAALKGAAVADTNLIELMSKGVLARPSLYLPKPPKVRRL